MPASDFVKTLLNTTAAMEFVRGVKAAISDKDTKLANAMLDEVLEALRLNPADAKVLSFQPDVAAMEAAVCAVCPADTAQGDRVDFHIRRVAHYWHVQATMIRNTIPIAADVKLILEQQDQWPAMYASMGEQLAENLANAKDPNRRRLIREERDRAKAAEEQSQ